MIRSALQFVLDLFEPDSAKPTDRAQRGFDPPTVRPKHQDVPVQFSRRRTRGWKLVKEGGHWLCQAPESLRQAPLEIQMELQAWIRSALHPYPGSRKRRKESEHKIFAWMSPHMTDRVPDGNSKGQNIDLQELFEELNHSHFEGRLQAMVRWSPRLGGLSTHQELRTTEGRRHLITISKAYDGTDVPKVAVAGVLFHEMCHIAVPPRPGRGGKRMVHHKEFRVAERRFPGWTQWRDWEKTHLARRVRNLGHLLTTSQN